MTQFDSEHENPYRRPRADLTDSSREDEPSLTTPPVDGNPWITMWTRPRGTIRGIVNDDSSRNVMMLACLAGVGSFSDVLLLPSIGFFWIDWLLILVVGPLASIACLYANSYLMRWAGQPFEGAASLDETRSALAWSMIPQIALGVIRLSFWIFLSASHMSFEMIKSYYIEIQTLLMFWHFVLVVRSLAEVHRISSLKMIVGMILFSPVLFLWITEILPSLCWIYARGLKIRG